MNFKETRSYSPQERPQFDSTLSRKDNIVQIIKPEGRYTIAYGRHNIEQKVGQLPSDLNCLVLETGRLDWSNNPDRCLRKCTDSVQYSSVVKEYKTRNAPIVFADLAYKYPKLPLAEFVFPLAAETGHGIGLLQSSISDFMSSTSRIEFSVAAVKLAIGTWLSAPIVSQAINLALYESKSRRVVELNAQVIKRVMRSHPELELLFRLRNNVIAHKEQYLMEKYGYSHIGTIIGAGHILIEDEIQKTPEKRLKYLNRLKLLIKKAIIPESFYKIAINTFHNGSCETKFEDVPDLKELITN